MKLITYSLLILLALPLSAIAAPPAMQSLSELWLDIRVLNEPLVAMYNRVADEDDIIRVESVRDLALLKEAQKGRKLLVFKSVVEAEALLPQIASEVDIIGYNLESGPANRADEQATPVESAIKMRELADEYGLTLAFGPDHNFALSHGVAIAPYVDIFVLQVQLVQNRPDVVRDFVLPLIPELRAANPDLQVSIQIRTEASSPEEIAALVSLIDSIRDSQDALNLDGVSILTSKETVVNAEALIKAIKAEGAEVNLNTKEITPPEYVDSEQISKQAVTETEAETKTENNLWAQLTRSLPIAMACTLSALALGSGAVYLFSCAGKSER